MECAELITACCMAVARGIVESCLVNTGMCSSICDFGVSRK
jgi:hypothetical protein